MKHLRIISLIFALCTPLLVTAHITIPPHSHGAFNDVMLILSSSLNIVIVFLFLVATVIFLWGVVQYIMAGGDEDKVTEARNMIIWGIVFLAVMVAVWGFVNVVLDFIFGNENATLIPDIDTHNVPQQ